jgi:hypothetical protein
MIIYQDDMSVAWTYLRNVSILCYFMDIYMEYVQSMTRRMKEDRTK